MAWKATLVRGNVYYLGSKRFENGVARKVTDAEKLELEGPNGQEVVHTSGKEKQKISLDKFEFEHVGEAATEDTKESTEGGTEESNEGTNDAPTEETPKRTRQRNRKS